MPCSAGKTLLRLEPDGTVFRCPGDKTVLGNVLDKVTLMNGDEPCIKHRCPCRGLDHVHTTPVQDALVEGVQYAVVGDSERASAAFGRVMELLPGHPCASNNLGVLALRRGDRKEAVARFRAALDVRPDHAPYAENLTSAEAGEETLDPALCLDVNFENQK